MAAAWFNRLADPAKATALSAGTRPGPHLHPEVLAAMREVGVDLSEAKPQQRSRAKSDTPCNHGRREDWTQSASQSRQCARSETRF